MLVASSVTSQNLSLEVRHKAALTDSETGIKVPFQSDKFNFTLIWERRRTTLSSYIRIQAQPSHKCTLSMTALREGGWKRVTSRGRKRKRKRSAKICPRRVQIMEICRVSRHMIFLSFPQNQTRLPMSGWVTVQYSEDALAGVVCVTCFWQEWRDEGWWTDGKTLASASLFSCLAVCSWLEWISAQHGTPRPCQERWLFGNGVWQAEESCMGVTHMLLSRGKALAGVSATPTPQRSVLISMANSFPEAPAVSRTRLGEVREKNINL